MYYGAIKNTMLPTAKAFASAYSYPDVQMPAKIVFNRKHGTSDMDLPIQKKLNRRSLIFWTIPSVPVYPY